MKLVKDINKDSSNRPQVSDKEAEEAVKKILTWIGEDPTREGLIETPKRVVKAFKEYFSGYHQDANKALNKTFGDVDGYDDMVIEKNISFESHCEHHMAPIIGIVHIAYIPSKKVVGLSKLARTVEVYAKRLQTQERLTMQIANTLMDSLNAKGVAVSIDSTHHCMTMRGMRYIRMLCMRMRGMEVAEIPSPVSSEVVEVLLMTFSDLEEVRETVRGTLLKEPT